MTHETPDEIPSPAEIAAAWRRELPGARTESIEILTPVWRVAKLLTEERQRTLQRLGIDESTLDLLSTLRRAGPPYQLTTRQIAARSLVTAGAISQRLTRAESAGLITREPTAASRRGVLVTLTPEGHRLTERVVPALLEHETSLTDRLPAAERAVLTAALTTLAAALRPAGPA
ncbi:MarR family winged helix-turn-helix transcriptional regulator [Nocardia sp. CY41]|uniref:MarR family winged helix-turn-helix transcriptional regulator n=1 Tax=Nocardia sp. CY41 TaxID=2608686 RepID=UPI00135BB311|nr:MarR family transcriptional regulator [Nocardia sp. CY41]